MLFRVPCLLKIGILATQTLLLKYGSDSDSVALIATFRCKENYLYFSTLENTLDFVYICPLISINPLKFTQYLGVASSLFATFFSPLFFFAYPCDSNKL